MIRMLEILFIFSRCKYRAVDLLLTKIHLFCVSLLKAKDGYFLRLQISRVSSVFKKANITVRMWTERFQSLQTFCLDQCTT